MNNWQVIVFVCTLVAFDEVHVGRARYRLEQAVLENVFFFGDDCFDLVKNQFLIKAPLVVLVVLFIAHAVKFFQVKMSPKTKHLKWNIIGAVTQINHAEPVAISPIPYVVIEHISGQVPLISRMHQQLYKQLPDLFLLLHTFHIQLPGLALLILFHVAL